MNEQTVQVRKQCRLFTDVVVKDKAVVQWKIYIQTHHIKILLLIHKEGKRTEQTAFKAKCHLDLVNEALALQ